MMTFKIVLSLTTGLGQFRYPLHSCLRAYFGLFLWNPETFSGARFLTSCIMASLIKICLFLLSLSILSLSLSSLFLKFCSPLPISDLPPLTPSSHLPPPTPPIFSGDLIYFPFLGGYMYISLGVLLVI